MAIINSKGNYLKIISIDFFNKLISYEIYKSEEIRRNVGDFDKIIYESKVIESLNTNSISADKSWKDEGLRQAYIALKLLPEFTGWIDFV